MKKTWLSKIAFLVVLSALGIVHAESSYVFCIEGGGTKTILQILNQKGEIVPLIKNEVKTDKIITNGSNINVVGTQGVSQVLKELFQDVKIDENQVSLVDLFADSSVIAGMAGVTPPQNRQAVTSLFQEMGFNPKQIQVLADAEMALELVGDQGIILISGTGSVCFGKKEEERFRVGGLGKVLGDEGSGYHIGLEAIKAALAETYGWGDSTALTSSLKEFFHVQDLKTLIPQIGLGEITQSKIASCAPLVFEKAAQNDLQAQEVIQSAASELGDLLAKMLKISSLTDCEVHLYGGIFKSVQANEFIQKIKNQIPNAPKNLKFINKANDNPAVLFALKHKHS